jgi:hypothetical protein
MLSTRKIFSTILIIALMAISTFARNLNDWKNVESLVKGLKVNVTLKDGQIIKGKLATTKTNSITVMVEKQKMEINKDVVARVTKIDPTTKFFQSLATAGTSTVNVVTGVFTGAGVGIERGSKEDLVSIVKSSAEGIGNGVATADAINKEQVKQLSEVGEVLIYQE